MRNETPDSKLQIPNNSQAPSSNDQDASPHRMGRLGFGGLGLGFVWDLEFGAWCLFVVTTCILATAASAGTRVLHFPRDQYVGSLYVEDPCLGSPYKELGRDLSLPYGLSPRGLTLGGDWDYVGRAQGDAAVPAGRNVRLLVRLGHRKEDAGRLAALPPRQQKFDIMDRYPQGPLDLSGLSALEPNDLHSLYVWNLVRRADADDCVLKPIRHLTGLRILTLHTTGVTDKGLEYLRDLRSLRALEFSAETSITGGGLAVLKDLPNLEYLDLGTGTTDAGLKELGQLTKLRWLRIHTGRIWGPGLAELARLPRLEGLCFLGSDDLSGQHMRYLEGLTQLKSLSFWGVAESLSDAGMASIGKLRNLEELYFIGWSAPQFSLAGIAPWKDLKKLRKLDFGLGWAGPPGVRYGDDVARQLAQMPRLESIKGVAYLSAEGLKTIATLPNLKCLHVSLKDRHQGYAGPTGVAHLAKLRSLEELAFMGGESLSDDDAAQFESLPNMRNLFIADSNMTERGMASLGRLRYLEHLTIGGHGFLTKQALNELKDLTNLQTLDVSMLSLTKPPIDETLLNLASLRRLKTLELQGVDLQDGDLASLAGLRDLEWLAIDGSFTEAGLRRLTGLDSLKLMSLTGVSLSSGEGLSHLAEFPKLEDVHLRGQTTDAALRRLTGSPLLRSVSLMTDVPVRPATIDHLKQTLPGIESIHVDRLMPDSPPRIRSSPAPRGRSPRRQR